MRTSRALSTENCTPKSKTHTAQVFIKFPFQRLNSSGNCIKNILLAICLPEQPSLLDRRGWLPSEEGPIIFVDSDLLNKLRVNRLLIHDQNLLSLSNQRVENHSAPSLVSVDSGRKKMNQKESKSGISSCPCRKFLNILSLQFLASPPRQRRSNSSRMRELFKQSGDGRKVVVPSSLQSAIGFVTFVKQH